MTKPPPPDPRAPGKPKRKRARVAKPTRARPAVPRAMWPRRLLFAAGALLVVGLAIVGTGDSEFGRWITLGALLLAIYAIHTFGRLGPDQDGSR